MTGLEIWLLAIGLAMDCFAVSIASGIILKRIQWRPMLDCHQTFNPTSPKVVFTMAIATSIDALAIGISFALLGINNYTEILSPILIIGFVSFVMSLIGLYFGIKCGCGCARKLKAELWGGIILVAIGLKILIEHLFLQ